MQHGRTRPVHEPGQAPLVRLNEEKDNGLSNVGSSERVCVPLRTTDTAVARRKLASLLEAIGTTRLRCELEVGDGFEPLVECRKRVDCTLMDQ